MSSQNAPLNSKPTTPPVDEKGAAPVAAEPPVKPESVPEIPKDSVPATTEPNVTVGADVSKDPVPVVAEASAPASPGMSPEELNRTREQIAQYTDPEIQRAIASLITANSNNPERLVEVVRNLVDEIDKAKQNPHSNYSVSPEIADIVDKIREEERKKPDPLNAFRGGQGASTPDGSGMALVGAVFGGAALAAAPEPEQKGFEVKDFGPTGAAIAAIGLTGGFVPLAVPDVRTDRGLGIT